MFKMKETTAITVVIKQTWGIQNLIRFFADEPFPGLEDWVYRLQNNR